MVGVTSLRIGADLTSIDPERNVTLLGDRPVLLIHGMNDILDRPERSADRVFAAAKQAGIAVSLHYCDGATHGAVIDKCQRQWAEWANDFLRPLVGG
jgi:pimeloyl-ACP methyl ester carboxylesterase